MTALAQTKAIHTLRRQIPHYTDADYRAYLLREFKVDSSTRLTYAQATGLGMSTAEFAVQTYGELRTEAVMLNVPWYRENAQPLKSAFEDDWIEIPADADIASDLRLIVVKDGVPQVPKLKSGVKKDRHGDAAVALMLAYAATKAGVFEIAYTPAPAGRDDDPADWLFPENQMEGRALW